MNLVTRSDRVARLAAVFAAIGFAFLAVFQAALAASQSRWENLLFGPLAVVLAALCTLVARSAALDARPERAPQ